ncbi:MAG: ParB/RepB/Spo0J family partition protein [Verrucomicrobia bacterium]|nr:ParB/RepB/Spo0J family partition protein [Verrucomicrobiota bacterium]
MSRPALGRGLGALLSGAATVSRPAAPGLPTESTAPAAAGRPTGVVKIPLDRLRPCPFQPRKEFAEPALRELADSIREQGIVQPLVVRPVGDAYELIAGERRWRAAQLAGLTEVPVIVREATDDAVLELALIENLQREDLNPLEEAQGYQRLIEQFHLRQEDVAAKVGKSRVAVANALRLLKLPPEVQAYLRDGHLTVGHAKVILGLASPEEQKLAAERVIRDALNVRQTEDLVADLTNRAAPTPPRSGAGRSAPPRDVHVENLEGRLRERFGTKVTLRYRQGRGSVDIRFFSDDELQHILQVAGVNTD